MGDRLFQPWRSWDRWLLSRQPTGPLNVVWDTTYISDPILLFIEYLFIDIILPPFYRWETGTQGSLLGITKKNQHVWDHPASRRQNRGLTPARCLSAPGSFHANAPHVTISAPLHSSALPDSHRLCCVIPPHYRRGTGHRHNNRVSPWGSELAKRRRKQHMMIFLSAKAGSSEVSACRPMTYNSKQCWFRCASE